MKSADVPGGEKHKSTLHFFVKGLGICLPPILTLLIVLWILGGINQYIIEPIREGVRWSIAKVIDDSVPTGRLARDHPDLRVPPLEYVDRNYLLAPELKSEFRQRLRDAGRLPTQGAAEVPIEWIRESTASVYVPLGERAVPYHHYSQVREQTRPGQMPVSATGVYMELVTIRYFQSLFHLSAVAVIVVIVLVYFLGRLVTVRIGAWAVHKFESVVLARVPVISNVYSSVKQVTDFVFSERTVAYNRVVAIEYPRRGIWSLGFVTGDSMLEIAGAAGEPLVSVLIPSSPMPVTGYTMNVPRSEVLDLNITIDQAFQFCVSCGVLVPPHQKVTPERLEQEIAHRLRNGRGTALTSPGRLLPTNDGAKQPHDDGVTTEAAP